MGLLRRSALASWLPILLALSACVPKRGGEASEVSTDPDERESGPLAACGRGPSQTLALLEPSETVAEREPCPLVVVPGAEPGSLALHGLAPGEDEEAPEVLASGKAPPSCGPELELCELSGVHDELGPVILVRERGPESEVPAQVYVGWVIEPSQTETLVFAPTWHGPSSVSDHTRIGPPWALAPFDCGDGALSLLLVPRLPEAAGEEPSTALRGLEGRWTAAEDGGALPPEQVSERELESCRPIFDVAH